MNLIDIAVLMVFALFALVSYHKGFVVSIASIACFFISWALAMLLLMPVASNIKKDEKLMAMMLYYTEGSEKLSDVEYNKLNIEDLSSQEINQIVDEADLVHPFDARMRSNIAKEAFIGQGAQTLGDYFSLTIVYTCINAICFVLLFLIIRGIASIIINAIDFAASIPVLRQFDGLISGGVGIIRGFLAVFVLFSIVPVIITVLPSSPDKEVVTLSSMFIKYINSSFFGGFFFKSNFLINFVPGI